MCNETGKNGHREEVQIEIQDTHFAGQASLLDVGLHLAATNTNVY